MIDKKQQEIEKVLERLPKAVINPVRRAFLREKIMHEIKKEKYESLFDILKKFFSIKNIVPIGVSTALIFVSFFALAVNQKKEAVATFSSISGSVFIEDQFGTKRRASKESTLKVGDKILVSKNSEAKIKFMDESVSSLTENTEIKIDSAMRDVEKGDKKLVSVSLKKGKIKTIKKKGNKSKFAVKTPNKVVESTGEKPIEVSVDEKQKNQEADTSKVKSDENKAKNISSKIKDEEENLEKPEVKKVSNPNAGNNDIDDQEAKTKEGSQKTIEAKNLNFTELIIKGKIIKVKLEQAIYDILLFDNVNKYDKDFAGYKERLNKICKIFDITEKAEETCLSSLVNLSNKYLSQTMEAKEFLIFLNEIKTLEVLTKSIYEKRSSLLARNPKSKSKIPEVTKIQILLFRENLLSESEKEAIHFIYVREAKKLGKSDIENIENDEKNLPALSKIFELINNEDMKSIVKEKISKIKLLTEKKNVFSLIQNNLKTLKIEITNKGYSYLESEVHVYTNSGLKIMFLKENIEGGIESLKKGLSGINLSSNDIKYVDLRTAGKIFYQ